MCSALVPGDHGFSRRSAVVSAEVLYCGDTTLETAASYFAGVLTWSGRKFEYLRSDQNLADSQLTDQLRLIVFSDYPAARVSHSVAERCRERILAGCGLLMLGGWESFHGLGGDWETHPLADLLPVTISDQDDRVNFSSPCLVRPTNAESAAPEAGQASPAVPGEAILAGLPWIESPPVLGGLNRVTAKPDSTTLLTAEHYSARWCSNEAAGFEFRNRYPLLVVGSNGRGRVAALMTDLAPHWVGGWVDWGPERIVAQGPGAGAIEVGSHYAAFIRQLVDWTANNAT